MNASELATILNDITLPKGWTLRAMEKGDGFLLQITFWARDTDPPFDPKEQRCRKWYVSSHASLTEVVRTVYKAGVAAWEHEFDETFKYMGVAVYHPHVNVQDLAEQLGGRYRHLGFDQRTEPVNATT